ncbi:hypothetical protein SEA_REDWATTLEHOG_92 [Gordonia phage RedWattleHog]|uniref:Uncharacterized protein n=1 Tax=Gordonia phage Stormageddon TaxID=2656541 RepID=A0A649VRS3_9CAUD|nr:hypothetical protein KHQ86_gp211 [Gordonia phage Stormageddon]QGJ94951.1 hypothetical protein SEA_STORMAGEDDON_89 [Gordonia phage Stormageddon]QLF83595.1 hypothetical protein SEA_REDWATTLEHOG_92 [Gordonia phage RedWattleHog]
MNKDPFENHHEIEVRVALKGEKSAMLSSRQLIYASVEVSDIELIQRFTYVLSQMTIEVENALRAKIGLPSLSQAERMEYERQAYERTAQLQRLRGRGMV